MFGLKQGVGFVVKKLKLAISLVLICVFLFLMASGTLKASEKNEDEEINLEGQWKVTDYMASEDMTAAYDYYEDFLGRSIVIEPDRIIQSFGCGDVVQEDVVSQYRIVEVKVVNGGTYGSRLGKEWYRKYADQDVTVVRFRMPESGQWNATSTFVVTEEGEVLCRYLGNTVIIGEDGMEIYGGSGMLPDRLETGGYTSAIVDKYGYQNEKGIHDELGLTNEEIQVFTGNIKEPGNSILDGEIVAVSRTEVIIKIYQGWYLLEKT